MTGNDGPLAAGIEQPFGMNFLTVVGLHTNVAIRQLKDLLHARFLANFGACRAGLIEHHLVEDGPLDIERAAAGCQALTEVETDRLFVPGIAHAELDAELIDMR